MAGYFGVLPYFVLCNQQLQAIIASLRHSLTGYYVYLFGGKGGRIINTEI